MPSWLQVEPRRLRPEKHSDLTPPRNGMGYAERRIHRRERAVGVLLRRADGWSHRRIARDFLGGGVGPQASINHIDQARTDRAVYPLFVMRAIDWEAI